MREAAVWTTLNPFQPSRTTLSSPAALSAAEYAAFRSPQAEQYQELYYQAVLDRERKRAEAAGTTFDEAAFRPRFLEQFPLGFVEMQVGFEEGGDYGRWRAGMRRCEQSLACAATARPSSLTSAACLRPAC